MNKRAKTILSLSTALPAMALAAFLLIQPQSLAAEESDTCLYAGLAYSVGATVNGACTDGKVQTCQPGGIWSLCAAPLVVNAN